MSFDLSACLPYRLAVAAARISKGIAEIYRVEFGLIEKRENLEDRRLLDMRLTTKGRDLIARLVPIADARLFRASLLRLLETKVPKASLPCVIALAALACWSSSSRAAGATMTLVPR